MARKNDAMDSLLLSVKFDNEVCECCIAPMPAVTLEIHSLSKFSRADSLHCCGLEMCGFHLVTSQTLKKGWENWNDNMPPIREQQMGSEVLLFDSESLVASINSFERYQNTLREGYASICRRFNDVQ